MGNPWFDHLKKVRKANPNLAVPDLAKLAKKTYTKVESVLHLGQKSRKSSKSSKSSKSRKSRKSKKSKKSRKSRKSKK